jgi:hypothetical protein
MEPFPLFPVPTNRPMCPLPSVVHTITTQAQCQSIVNDCRDNASARASALASPRNFQFAKGFHEFANADQAQIIRYNNGAQAMLYKGGCDLLSNETTKRDLWPAASKQLENQLANYHSNGDSMFGEAAVMRCSVGPGEDTWKCGPGTDMGG